MSPVYFLADKRSTPNKGYTALNTKPCSVLPNGGEMVRSYTEYMLRRRRSANTIRLRLFYINKFWEWYGRDLGGAAHDDFQAYISSNPQWSENTQQAATASLRALYGWAYREGLLSSNPARDLPTVTVHRRRPRIASESIIRSAILTTNISDRAMIMLGAECGLRVSEIATLKFACRRGEWLDVIGKGNQMRTVNASPELCMLLDAIEATLMRHGNYFPGRSGIHPIHPSTAWRRITDLINSNPHSLRRRAGTVVYRASGHDIRLAQTFLGHKQSATTEAYLDIRDDDLAKAGSLTRIAA